MSADNGLVIRNHPNGGYAVVMEFGDDGARPVTDTDTEYNSFGEAMAAADREMRDGIVEYGIRLHAEVRNRLDRIKT